MTGRISVTVDDDGIALLVRDNPPCNATTVEVTGLLHCQLDERVRVLVIASAGRRAFGAGSDITELPDYLDFGNVLAPKMSAEHDVQALLERHSRPTVAALNGPLYVGIWSWHCAATSSSPVRAVGSAIPR